MWGATGYNAVVAPNLQANVSPVAVPSLIDSAGPYNGVHLFAQTASPSAYIHCVLEQSGNLFAHFHCGYLNAAGGASPAFYLAASLWSVGNSGSFYDSPGNGNCLPWGVGGAGGSSQVYCTVDGFTGWFLNQSQGSTPHRAFLPVGGGAFQDHAVKRTPNTFNQLTVLFPLHIFLERSSGNAYSHIGDVLDARCCNVVTVNPKDEVTIGADTWKYFPAVASTPPLTWNISNNPRTSGPYGYAFRKNA